MCDLESENQCGINGDHWTNLETKLHHLGLMQRSKFPCLGPTKLASLSMSLR